MTGEYQFCRKNCLSSQVLSNIEDLKAQLTTSLVDGQFLELGEAETDALNRYTSVLLLVMVKLTAPGSDFIHEKDILWKYHRIITQMRTT